MNHTGLINYLIHQRNFKRYLEISVHESQLNFAHVFCADKTAALAGNAEMFFEDNRQKFDIIFIDGIHTEEQALKDIENSCRCLLGQGIIVIHDCMPPSAWHQREIEAYKKGENWTGTVWKAVLRIFNSSIYKCTLLDTDWGCGIIDSAQTQVPLYHQLPDKLNYEQHYASLIYYRKSVPVYLREQVKVFYHLACMGNWQLVFEEQMSQLKINGFNKIHLSLLGTQQDLQHVTTTLDKIKIGILQLFYNTGFDHFERPALQAIEQHARLCNGHVLYLHSKGVSNHADESKTKWRQLMMHELVDNWEACMAHLPYYDVIGVNWREMPPTSHFCGNFWYASTSYLRKLTDFNAYYQNPHFRIWDRIDNMRLGCEFWISSAKEPPRVLSLFCRNIDFCNQHFWRGK